VDNTNILPNRDSSMKKKEVKSTFYEYTSLSELSPKQQQLVDEASKAASNAYAPYSEFHVGAAVLLENGHIIHANNQENSAFPSGLCAERTAVFYANSQYPNTPVLALAVAAEKNGSTVKYPIPACGSCLQVLLESEKRHQTPMEIFLYGADKIYWADSVEQFLPYGFTSINLKRS